MEFVFEVQQFFALTLHHLRDRDARPARYHLCDIIGSHFLADEGVATLGRSQLLLDSLDIILQDLQFRVADLCHLAIVALALGTFSLEFQALHLLLVLLDLVDELALTLPLGTELGLLFLQLSDIFIQLGNLGFIPFALDRLALDLELGEATRDLIELLWHGVALHTQFGGCLIHQVDGLIW